jgi:uncharacterized iron-regulated protein
MKLTQLNIWTFKKGIILCCTLLLFLSGCSQQEQAGPLYRVADRSQQTLTDALFENIGSDIFFVGEHHDNPHHHRNQLDLIREIHETAEKPLAIGLEMFETESQEYLDKWVNSTLPLDDFVKIYYQNWDQPWILYRDIFLYAREHRIPMIALNIPRRIVRKVARQGFASLTTADMSELPEGVTCDVTPEYKSFIQKVFGWHGLQKDSFISFCEAQILWDTVMAINIVKYYAQDNSLKMVVLAGDGHAWKPGIPRQILSRKNMTMTVFLPETPKLDRRSATPEDTDYLWLQDII